MRIKRTIACLKDIELGGLNVILDGRKTWGQISWKFYTDATIERLAFCHVILMTTEALGEKFSPFYVSQSHCGLLFLLEDWSLEL